MLFRDNEEKSQKYVSRVPLKWDFFGDIQDENELNKNELKFELKLRFKTLNMIKECLWRVKFNRYWNIIL